MGLLTKGDRLLSWPETKEQAETVRRIGLRQFIAVYHRFKDRQEDTFKWGDEVQSYDFRFVDTLPFCNSWRVHVCSSES